MSDEQNWRLRGIFSQVASVQQQIMEALASDKLTANRVRDMKRALTHIVEQLEDIEA